MNADWLLPVVTSLAWLTLCGAALASYRLEWSRMVKMALVWVAIFGGLFLVVEWFMVIRGTTGALL